MNTLLKILIVSSSLSLASAVSLPAYAEDAPASPTSVEAAKTPADHEALAQQYEADAKANLAKAAEHKRMASGYKNLGGKGGAQHFTGPCDKLVKAYQDAAAQSADLAKLHHQFAEQLKK